MKPSWDHSHHPRSAESWAIIFLGGLLQSKNYLIHSPALAISYHPRPAILGISFALLGKGKNSAERASRDLDMQLIISLSFLPHQPKKPCGIRPLIYFCLQITTTSLWLSLRCRYQKSIINIQTNLMSTEDPEPGKKAREGRLYQAHGLVSVSSVHCELNLSWSNMDFILWVSNPRRVTQASNGCILPVRNHVLLFPQLAICCCLGLFACLFLGYYTLTIKL